MSALLDEKESLDDFFTNLRAGNPPYVNRWNHFLIYLAKAINMLHLLAAAGIQLFGGVSGDADKAAEALASGQLSYNPDVHCDHHGEHHHHGGSCGSHGCGEHHQGGHCGH